MSASGQILLRGDEAARAEPVSLVAPPPPFELGPTGPWASNLADAYEEARRDGFARGRVEGFDEGAKRGLQESRDRVASLIASLEALLDQVDERLAAEAESLAARTVDLALEIAAIILSREVATADNPGADAIARCLLVAPTESDLVAHLHPADVQELGTIDGLGDRQLEIKADERIERGDAVVRVGETLIDGRLARALERVAEVLQ